MKRKDRQKKIDYEKAVIFTQKAIPLAGLTGTCWNGKVFQGFDFKSFNFMTKASGECLERLSQKAVSYNLQYILQAINPLKKPTIHNTLPLDV